MNIRLELEGTIIKGKKYYTLVDADLLGSDDLPDDYMEDYPCAYMDGDDGLVVRYNHTTTRFFRRGENYITAAIDSLKSVLHVAGDRLHEINARLAKENEGWEGSKHTIII